ncbi:MAG TPA: hypothetical protein VGO93_12555 [Candidatus Xenobia bacterium]|jgi:hypothetical protein
MLLDQQLEEPAPRDREERIAAEVAHYAQQGWRLEWSLENLIELLRLPLADPVWHGVFNLANSATLCKLALELVKENYEVFDHHIKDLVPGPHAQRDKIAVVMARLRMMGVATDTPSLKPPGLLLPILRQQ